MSLADYLAKNYLTADSAPEKKTKKRKQKEVAAGSGLLIADDALEDWKTKSNAADEDAPTLGYLTLPRICFATTANIDLQFLDVHQSFEKPRKATGLPLVHQHLPMRTRQPQMLS